MNLRLYKGLRVTIEAPCHKQNYSVTTAIFFYILRITQRRAYSCLHISKDAFLGVT